MLLSTQDRQLLLPSGRIQTAGMLVGGVESAYAVGFDSNTYVSVAGDPAQLNFTGPFSVFCWVNLRQRGGDSAIVAKCEGDYEGWMLWLRNNTVNAYFKSGVRASGITNVTEKGWIHVGMSWDGTTAAVWLNGNIDGSSACAVAPNAAGEAFRIGAYAFDIYDRSMRGLIDDVRIYNRALTAAEVQSIYRNSSSPPTDGLVAYFPLDEGTGTTTTDTVGGLTGTLTNGPTWQPQVCPRLRSGRDTTQSWGVSFDNVNDYITVSDASILRPAAITVAFWIKPTAIGLNDGILGKTTSSAWSDGFGFDTYVRTNMGSRNVFFWLNNYSSNYVTPSGMVVGGTINANTWSHIAATYDGANVKFFVNGSEVDSRAYTTTIVHSTQLMHIGQLIGGYNIGGNIKDVRIYNSALSASDIAKLANNIPISATPVGHWKLDDGTGTTATDSSGNGNHGTLTNGPTWTGDIPQWFRPVIESSYALSCDGSNDYVSVASALVSAAPCTLMCWFNSSSIAADQTLLSVGQSANETNYFALRAAGAVASDPIQAVASSLSEAAAASASGYTASAWHHAAGVFASTTSRTAYLNGVAGTANTTSETPASIDATAIGRLTKQTPSEYAVASIDEGCIYSRALTAAEIADAAAGYLVSAGLISRYKLDGNAQDAHGTNHGTEQGGVGYSSNVPGTL